MKTKYEALMDKANDLWSGFYENEKKLYGKVANSTDPVFYLECIVDTLDVSGVEISEAFVELRNYMVEHYSFVD